MMGPDLGRIEKAKEGRRKQLLKWDEYDRTYQNNFSHRGRKKGSTGVRFESNLVFLEAASRGDLTEVKKLINSGINPDVANEDGLTALHQDLTREIEEIFSMAFTEEKESEIVGFHFRGQDFHIDCCIDNNLDICTLLLENNANVNAKDNEQWTPLHAAATCGNKELCGILINWGADLLALNIDGNMPYDLCDDDDTLILVETEMAKRHVTQKQIDEIRLGPEKEMLSDLKRHYAAGDDLQALDVQGAAPIHVAAACGYPEVTRYLLQLNLEPQLPDQDGWLPIHIAVSWGHLEVIEILVAYGADLNATTKNGQTVYDICDSKELQMRLKEVWDRREDLRSTVKKTSLSVNNNGNSNFTRGFGSSRRKSNTSIMRTSMRDKRRITRVDAERERQLGEQLASAVATKENGGSVEKVANITTAPSSPKSLSASVNANANTTNSNSTTLVALASNSRKSLSGGPESKQTPEVNGIGSTTARRGNDSNTTAPAVPPRNTRPVRLSDGPLASQSSSITTSASTLSVNDQHTKTSSSSTSTDNSTVTSNSTASNSSSASPSTFTETPESESSDSSRSNYVRPMQRNSNGQMVPIVNTTTTNNSDSARSPPSQRSRPTPPSRDNRSRTPGRSGVSVGSSASSYGSPRGQRVNTTAGAAAAAQLPPSNPTVLRQGPLPQQPQNEIPRPKANNVTSPSSFISTETLNSDYGSGGRKPFLCCHTM